MTKVFDVFRLAVKDIRSYWRSLATPIIGVAIVILIFASMMAAADGMRATFSSAGIDNILVLEEGSATPWSSVLARNMSEELVNPEEQAAIDLCLSKNGSVLVIGCGCGRECIALAKKGFKGL